MEEIFKTILGYEDHYEISNLGRIRSVKLSEKTIRKTTINKFGYEQVILSKGTLQSRKTFLVHRLLALTFIDKNLFNTKLVVNHINFKRSDNRLSNIEIVTNRENANKKHIPHTSKYTGVYQDFNSKKFIANISLKSKQIKLGVFETEEEAKLLYDTALENLHLYNGNNIDFRVEMTKLALPDKKIYVKIKKETAIKIKFLSQNNIYPSKQIAEMFNVTKYCVSDIKRNKSWKNLDISNLTIKDLKI